MKCRLKRLPCKSCGFITGDHAATCMGDKVTFLRVPEALVERVIFELKYGSEIMNKTASAASAFEGRCAALLAELVENET